MEVSQKWQTIYNSIQLSMDEYIDEENKKNVWKRPLSSK